LSDYDKGSEACDLLWGAQAIAKAINRTPRQVYHLAEAGLLPIKKVGKQLTASRKKLHRAATGDEPAA
jgi:hypothetical protein